MKIAALLASAFVATAVQAGKVTFYYCIEGEDCHNASVESTVCTDLHYPGTVKSIQNSGNCYLFPIQGCQGPPRTFPRGSYDHQDVYAQSVVCFEQSLPRNLAPAVQAEAVDVKYCYLDGTCVDTTVEPFECTNLEESGPLSSIQNGADCELHEYFNCHGRFFNVKRGAHDIKELKGKIVGSLLCGRPGLRRNPAPVVQDGKVTVNYCPLDGPCIDQQVEPFQCTRLDNPGPITSIQNTATCELYVGPHCSGYRIVYNRGGSDHLQTPPFLTIRCEEPGFQRNQRPMRRH